MKIFTVLDPFFRALSDGKLIRLTVAWVLRVLAMLVALAGLLGFITIISFSLKANGDDPGTRSAGTLIGSLILALFVLGWGYLSAGILVFRANSVEELGDSHFTVLSILSLLFRLNGEIIFVVYSLLGIGGCLFVWFTNTNPFSELGMLGDRLPFADSTSGGFLGGIELALLFLLIAFIGIVFFYALAELTVVLVEIALNTRGLRTVSPAAGGTPVSVSQPEPISVPPPPTLVEQPQISAQRYCRKCGQPLAAGVAFCDECGTQVG
jgi:hypothetical protein